MEFSQTYGKKEILNITPVDKKRKQNVINNYHPISLFPIFAKIFKRVIYSSLSNYFLSHKLFTPSRSRFLPGDSFITQLLSIIPEIQTTFDENSTVDLRGVFLDISKAFHKVWHDDLIFETKMIWRWGWTLFIT